MCIWKAWEDLHKSTWPAIKEGYVVRIPQSKKNDMKDLCVLGLGELYGLGVVASWIKN